MGRCRRREGPSGVVFEEGWSASKGKPMSSSSARSFILTRASRGRNCRIRGPLVAGWSRASREEIMYLSYRKGTRSCLAG